MKRLFLPVLAAILITTPATAQLAEDGSCPTVDSDLCGYDRGFAASIESLIIKAGYVCKSGSIKAFSLATHVRGGNIAIAQCGPNRSFRYRVADPNDHNPSLEEH